MSTKDFIKKSVLNAFTQYDAPKLAVALLAALALGILIYLVYRKFYTGVVYSRSYAVTLVGMCVLTCMVNDYPDSSRVAEAKSRLREIGQ